MHQIPSPQPVPVLCSHWTRRVLSPGAVLGLALVLCACTERGPKKAAGKEIARAVPVEVGSVRRGPLTYRRTVSGSLVAAAEFIVAPKVGGRIASLEVGLGDPVKRGQVVARLDSDEFEQTVRQAEADLAVAEASHAEAKGALEIAQRALERIEKLQEQGVSSEAQLDEGRADSVASLAHKAVTEATLARAQASLRAARIRLGYANVTADWSGDDEFRFVGERFVDEGSNVSANAALFSVVKLDPIVAVVYVGERDYRLLFTGQHAVSSADAWPGQDFEGRVARIAPVFKSASRQARVELDLPNPGTRLKPGMFVRATLELKHLDEATSVPADAVVERDGKTGVLALDADGKHVRWVPVTLGIRDETHVQVLDPKTAASLTGSVVTLGQELCDDGALVRVVKAAQENGAR